MVLVLVGDPPWNKAQLPTEGHKAGSSQYHPSGCRLSVATLKGQQTAADQTVPHHSLCSPGTDLSVVSLQPPAKLQNCRLEVSSVLEVSDSVTVFIIPACSTAEAAIVRA